MYNHYDGNSGRVRRVAEGATLPPPPFETPPPVPLRPRPFPPHTETPGPTPPPAGKPGLLPPPESTEPFFPHPEPPGGLFHHLHLEAEDLLLLLILYLLYRETEDAEFLLILAGVLLL